MTLRYVYRTGRPDTRYHIVTPLGTVCKRQNSNCYHLLDTFSDETPPGYALCGVCARECGLPSRRRKDKSPDSPKAGFDGLLAHFGVEVSKHSVRFQAESIRVCQEQYVRLFGKEFLDLKYAAARTALGQIRAGVSPNPPRGMAPVHGLTPLSKPPKAEKKAKPPKPRHTLSKERVKYLISNAFLASYEWKKLRYSVLKKHDGLCEVCGRGRPHGVTLNVDHIKPRRNRPDLALDVSNLQITCHECNMGKGNWDETDWRNRAPRMPLEEREGEQAAWDRFE